MPKPIVPAPAATSIPRPPRWPFLTALLHNPLALITGFFLLVVVIASLAAPLIAPYSPTALDVLNPLSGPSAKHLLGSDELGRDVLSRLLYAGLQAVLGVAEGLLTALVVALPLGILSGYLGGIFDRIVGAATDAILAIPAIILVLVVLAIFPNNPHIALISFGLLVSPGFARVIRGVTLPLKDADFVAAARICGVSEGMIMARHILPGVTRTAIVQASFVAASALHFVVALGFLGLTASPGTADWGQMVASAATLVNRQPWLLVPTGGLIALNILALTLFGNALRDASASASSGLATASDANPDNGAGLHQLAAAPTNDATAPLAADVLAPTPAGMEIAPQEKSLAMQAERPPLKEALMSVRDLSVVVAGRRGETLIVDKVSFDIRPGETIGLVGESGAGKSITALALLRLLPGAAHLKGGQVFFEGRDLVALGNREFDRLRGSAFGLVSQEPLSSLDPNFTVGSQLSELVRRHDKISGTKLKARCLELLRQVQLNNPEQVLKAYPHEVSGGMAQRIALAMALAGRPRLLVADEPTTALDVTVQKEILALLQKLQKETGMALVIVTHNFGVVADICDQVLVMYAGQVVEEAGVFELFERPLNPYSQGLLNANPSHGKPGDPLQIIPGRVPAPGSWPTGCRFAPRCALAAPECKVRPIPLIEKSGGRLTRCIRVDKLMQEEVL